MLRVLAMRPVAVALCLCTLPSLAAAGPVSVGFTVGKTQSKVDANQDADGSLGVFARLALSPRLAAQLDIERVAPSMRRGTLLAVLDLGRRGHLVPVLLAGYGIDRGDDAWQDYRATHLEAGFGVEYRADGGLSIGGDLRIGNRTLENNLVGLDAVPLVANPGMTGGEYRSARIYAGVRF
jgi:hypothetical protein